MKKVFLTVLLSAFLISGASAQITIGLKGGLNLATMSNGDSWESKVAFHAGVFVIYMLTEQFGLMPELLYSGQGSDYDEGSYTGSWNLDYIILPLLVRYMLIANLYAVGGVQLGFLLSAKEENNFGGSSEEIDIKDFMKTMDVGLVLGLMYQIARFNIYARYVFGITDADDFGSDGSANRVAQVGVGFRLKGDN